MNYKEFLESKKIKVEDAGFECKHIPDCLYPFQKRIFQWALKKGRAAVFADCGLGKTILQLCWADKVAKYSKGKVLIVAPLAVSEQTKREGTKFGIPVNICRKQKQATEPINITNYEMLEHFKPESFSGIVLDESSILKNEYGVYRSFIIDFCKQISYRLACTATPAPNDITEISNHAEYLGVLTSKEIKAMFFRLDGNDTQKWRLKDHGQNEFWRWLSTWAMAVRTPEDLGFVDDRFKLPKLTVKQYTVEGHTKAGYLFPMEGYTLQERQDARRNSLDERVQKCAELVNGSNEPWLIWCNLNIESSALTKAIKGAVEVKGSDPHEQKTERMMGFSEGNVRVLVTKPKIAGHGMNWQHCSNMAFVGLSDSWEAYYQAIRRCWRFGQTKPVKVHVIVANTEGAVVSNLMRKEKEAEEMMARLVQHMNSEYTHQKDDKRYVGTEKVEIPTFLKKGNK
jgi:hypothetical protein